MRPAGTSRVTPSSTMWSMYEKLTSSKRTAPSPLPGGQRVAALGHLERRVEDLEDAIAGGDRALHEPGQPADHLGRVHEQHEVAVEGDQLAEREVALDHLAAAVPEQQQHRHVGQEGDQRDVDGAQAGGRHAGLEHRRAALAELLQLVVLTREDAHDARAGHVLLGRRGHVGDLLLHVLEHRLQLAAEAHRHDQQEGEEGQGDERQLQSMTKSSTATATICRMLMVKNTRP